MSYLVSLHVYIILFIPRDRAFTNTREDYWELSKLAQFNQEEGIISRAGGSDSPMA